MGTKLTPVAIDLETTGFAVDDEITVVGVVLPLGCRVFCHTDRRDSPPELETELRSRVEEHIVLTTHTHERGLLEALERFTTERLIDDDYCLVAYNGERYRGGFDLPFLRTRAATHDLAWPFVDLAYADLQPMIESRFNTVVDNQSQDGQPDEITDLCGAYATLIGDGLADLDPFAESSEAVTAFADGAFVPLIMHNVADILRTQALAELIEQYCPTSDYRLKSLTPPSRDTDLQ